MTTDPAPRSVATSANPTARPASPGIGIPIPILAISVISAIVPCGPLIPTPPAAGISVPRRLDLSDRSDRSDRSEDTSGIDSSDDARSLPDTQRMNSRTAATAEKATTRHSSTTKIQRSACSQALSIVIWGVGGGGERVFLLCY
jgi:hypothetical protein